MVDRTTKVATYGLNLATKIQAIEHEAHQLGAHVTAHALNRAKNALGYEMAGDTVMAGKAMRGER
ncbi:MAG TPA: hypothetical protein VKT73_12775 [Xanthobacteraceae bacterium]|nr:hypothetical protein [Xanthobacteraceae bacterium]